MSKSRFIKKTEQLLLERLEFNNSVSKQFMLKLLTDMVADNQKLRSMRGNDESAEMINGYIQRIKVVV